MGPDPRANSVFRCFSEPFSVIASITQQPIDLCLARDESPRADVITDLTGGYEEAQWASSAVTDRVKLGVYPALCPPDQTATFPFFSVRLDAVQWASR
jgi:hypothetical protein